MTHTLDTSTAVVTSTRRTRLRVALASMAVLATLPYIVLKALWLTGSTVGLNDPAALSGGVMEAANAITLLMELTAGGLAVALVLDIGRRIPGFLVQVPMFVGTGLLGGILVLLPLEVVWGLVSAPSASQSTAVADNPIAGWVYAMVYGGFGVLGISLLAIFVLHSWDRWIRPGGWTTRLSAAPPVPARQRRLAVTHVLAMVVICVAGLIVAARAEMLVTHAVMAVLMSLVSGAGLTALALRTPGSLRGSTALVMTFAGAAVVAAWGLYLFVVPGIPNPLRGGVAVPAGLVALELLRGVSGVVTVFLAGRLRPVTR